MTGSSSYVGNAGTFLVETLLGLYIMAMMLRFLFQLVHADFHNPFSQFVVRITDPVLGYFRRFVPNAWGVDLPSVVLLLVLQFLEIWIVGALLSEWGNPVGIVVLSVARLLALALQVFTFAIIIHVVMSWLNPHAYNPMVGLLYSLTEPLLGPVRRWVPPVAGLDISPILAIVGLQFISMLFIAPIADLGRRLLL